MSPRIIQQKEHESQMYLNSNRKVTLSFYSALKQTLNTNEQFTKFNPVLPFVFFSQLNVGDKLFENVVNAMAFSADQSYGSLDKPVDRDQYVRNMLPLWK